MTNAVSSRLIWAAAARWHRENAGWAGRWFRPERSLVWRVGSAHAQPGLVPRVGQRLSSTRPGQARSSRRTRPGRFARRAMPGRTLNCCLARQGTLPCRRPSTGDVVSLVGGHIGCSLSRRDSCARRDSTVGTGGPAAVQHSPVPDTRHRHRNATAKTRRKFRSGVTVAAANAQWKKNPRT